MKNNLLIDNDIDDSNPEKSSSELKIYFKNCYLEREVIFSRRANFLFLNVNFWPNFVWK